MKWASLRIVNRFLSFENVGPCKSDDIIRYPYGRTSSPSMLFRRLLGRGPAHFAEPIIREVLGLPFFDGLQNETGDEFGLVAIGVIG